MPSLPIILPTEEQTQIMDDVVMTLLKELTAEADATLPPDGALIGDVNLKARQRMTEYINNTVALEDYIFIADPYYEKKVRLGLDPPPQSPFWLNLLSIPGEFTAKAKDFMQLQKQYGEVPA